MTAIEYLLSSMLAAEGNAIAMNTITELLDSSDIGKPYTAMYQIIVNTWKRYKLVEPVAIHMEIMAQYPDPKHSAKLLTQLNDLWGLVVTDSSWQHYLKLALLEIKIKKIKTLGDVISESQYDPKAIDEALSDIKCQINEMIDKYKLEPIRNMASITEEYLNQIDKEITTGDSLAVRTGLYYESKIRGFRPGDYILLAGRPKMGKSAVANTIVCRALRNGKRVMLINKEMDERQVLSRLYSCMYHLPHELLHEPAKMTEQQLHELMDCAEQFKQYPLNLYCLSMKTPADIEAEANRLIGLGTPADLLVIDYLGLLKPNDKKSTQYESMSELSWEIKCLAADLRIPVLALHQVNRKCEERPNKRPLPVDLRDSGSLEQDCTAAMFIYRDEVYNENTQEPGVLEINVAINRNGKIGSDKYAVNFDNMEIANLSNFGETND